MIPNVFEYHAAASVTEAIKLLGQYPDDAKLLAGGHSLLPMMKLRFAEPGHLIDLNGIDELKGVTEAKGVTRIGAMTTESELIESALLGEKNPLIPAVARMIADPQVRNRGTIGGDIAHGDPGNDHPAAMLALNATFVLQGPGGERRVAANEFFLGTFHTDMATDEVMTAIEAPVCSKGMGWGFNKLKRKTGDFATAASTVILKLNGGVCEDIRIALTNVGPCAFRAEAAEALLRGQKIDDNLIEQAADKAMQACEPVEDLRGDVEYKTAMAGEMTRRSIKDALGRALKRT